MTSHALAYNRRMLCAVALALSFAVLAVSAALAWDQMNLVIDNVQRRNYVEQLDALKNQQRKFIYTLDQIARLHSRLLIQPHQHGCETGIIFPGELNLLQDPSTRDANTDPVVTTTLDAAGCTWELSLLRKLSRSLAFSIRNLWNYPEISYYTFDLKGHFLAQSVRVGVASAPSKNQAREEIASAIAPLQPGIQHFLKTGAPALPFITGMHRRAGGYEGDEVLSIGVPIYGKNKLFAITAIDIEHQAFSKVFMPSGRLPGFFVFDISRSAPILLSNITADEHSSVRAILRQWHAINTIAHDLSVTTAGGRFYLAEAIDGTPWVAVYSFNFGDILAVSESLWMWIGFSMFGVLLLLWSGIYLINRYMLAPLTLASQRIAASEALNRTIIATAPVGLCMVGLQTRQLLLANDLARSYAERWGQQPDLARSILDAYNTIAGPSGEMQQNKVLYMELPAPQDIDAPPLLAAFSHVRYQECGVLLCGLSDITLHKQAEAMLLQARQSADEANAAKSVFLATISHEIRTPLHGAMGNLELLENTNLSPSQHSTIGTINRAFLSLLQIIDNVLDLSKAGAGQLHLSSDIFNPLDLLEDVALTFAPCIAKKEVAFFCLLDHRLPNALYGDEARLRQIFNNLLSNAVKFTGRGKITLRADLSELQPDGCAFTVQIIDSGIGISHRDQKKLFKPFQQANHTIAGTFGGTGLGLSLVKNLCDAMGGTIEVNSRPDQGACFTVSLKLPISNGVEDHAADDNAGPDFIDSTVSPTPALTGVKIALCCDDPLWHRNLCGQLAASGATVIAAESAIEAQQSAAENDCDTFLIACQDYQDTIYFPRQMHYPHARRVLLTPLGPLPPELQASGIRVSALSRRDLLLAVNPAFDVTCVVGYPPCPVQKTGMGEAIEHYSTPHKTPKTLECLSAASDAATHHTRHILLVEDDLVNIALAQQQLAVLGYTQIDLARNGQEALEKCRKQDYQIVLTDQFMPEMDGNLLAAALRQQAYPASVIMVTASRPSPVDRKNLDAVLLKPVSLEQLRNALSSCHLPLSSPISTPITSSSKSSSQPSQSSQLILWNAFLEDYTSTMDTLEQASREGDRSLCLQQLHKLKGALGILRQPLVKQVSVLERRSKTISFEAMSNAYRGLRETLDQLIASRNNAAAE
jgi:two-component system capsular synthesis sensor histidine kinase RcsC